MICPLWTAIPSLMIRVGDDVAAVVVCQNHGFGQDPGVVADMNSPGGDRFVEMGFPGDSTILADVHAVSPLQPGRIELGEQFPDFLSHIDCTKDNLIITPLCVYCISPIVADLWRRR